MTIFKLFINIWIFRYFLVYFFIIVDKKKLFFNSRESYEKKKQIYDIFIILGDIATSKFSRDTLYTYITYHVNNTKYLKWEKKFVCLKKNVTKYFISFLLVKRLIKDSVVVFGIPSTTVTYLSCTYMYLHRRDIMVFMYNVIAHIYTGPTRFPLLIGQLYYYGPCND